LNKLNDTPNTSWSADKSLLRLLLAIGLSALLHFVVANQFNIVSHFKFDNQSQLIEAHLTHLPSQKPEVSKPPEPEKPKLEKPKPVKPKVTKPEPIKPVEQEPIVKPLPEAAPLPAIDPQPEVDIPPLSNVPDSVQAKNDLPQPDLPLTDLGKVEPAKIDDEQTSTTTRHETVLPILDEKKSEPYVDVDTSFDVFVNDDKGRAGKASIHYRATQEGHYKIESQVNATGVLALFYPDLKQKSRGLIGKQGLKPDDYQYALGDKEKKAYKATFDWDKNVLTMQSSKGEKQAPLVESTQDLLSFMYQYMFVPPLNTMKMTITNGKKVGDYDYEFVGEENLDLEFGNIKTYHIRHSKADSDDKTELWLAVDYRFLPVKIVKTEKDGTVIQQIATSMKTVSDYKDLPQ
jgi:hypothetical protein